MLPNFSKLKLKFYLYIYPKFLQKYMDDLPNSLYFLYDLPKLVNIYIYYYSSPLIVKILVTDYIIIYLFD